MNYIIVDENLVLAKQKVELRVSTCTVQLMQHDAELLVEIKRRPDNSAPSSVNET